MGAPNIHIFGIQGSGKGTQSSLLVNDYSFTYASSGNLFRARAEVSDKLGQRIAADLKVGKLLPDELLFQTIDEFLTTHDISKGFLGDGVIRTVGQYHGLKNLWVKHGLNEPFLINLDLSEKTALERIHVRESERTDPSKQEYHKVFSGKLIHRTDDNPLAIEERFRIFRKMTVPVIEEFKKSGHYSSIPADRSVEAIHTDIISAITSAYPELTPWQS